mmetsp:Transcript_104623/g.223612  ORF Transcript_104623/g.223612 Transcript_104623/m.223612 type:complete len:229 (-) Transcript_104623:48-734(-)
MGNCFEGMTKSRGGQMKYTYFPLHARGLPILLALEVGGVDYVGKPLPFSQWAEMKASGVCPFGYLALLELADGTKINETNAVAMTVGKRAGLLGQSEKDFGISTMLACKAAEVFTEFTKVQPTMFTVKNWDSAAAQKLLEWSPKCDDYLKQFEALCGADGKFTSEGNTVGELHLWALLYHFKVVSFKLPLPPKLATFYARIEALPAVQRCVTGKTQMGELADYVVPVP